jgi:hypothetical protein
MEAISNNIQIHGWDHTDKNYVQKQGRDNLNNLIKDLFQKSIVKELTSFTPGKFEFTLKIQEDGRSTMIVKDSKTEVNLLDKFSSDEKVVQVMNLIHNIIAAKEDEESCSPVTLESPKEDKAYEKEIDHYKELMAVTTYEMARFQKVAESTISRLQEEIKSLKDKFKSNTTLLTKKDKELETAIQQKNSAEELITIQLKRFIRAKTRNDELEEIIIGLNEDKQQALLQLRKIQEESDQLLEKAQKKAKDEFTEQLASAFAQAEKAKAEAARTRNSLAKSTKEFNATVSMLHALSSAKDSNIKRLEESLKLEKRKSV